MNAGAGPASREYAWPEGHWDWPVHLPYRHGVKAAGQMIFLGGQVAMDQDGGGAPVEVHQVSSTVLPPIRSTEEPRVLR